MEDLKNLDQAALLDLLSRKTTEYMRMFKEGATQKEYEGCKKMIGQITAEIELRKAKKEQGFHK